MLSNAVDHSETLQNIVERHGVLIEYAHASRKHYSKWRRVQRVLAAAELESRRTLARCEKPRSHDAPTPLSY